MKEVLSLSIFGIGTLFFFVFFTTLKPIVITAASGSGTPRHCSAEAPLARSLIFTTASWSDVERQN